MLSPPQVKKTFTRWKPDWEGAARYYREAVKAYKMSGDTAGTIQGQGRETEEHMRGETEGRGEELIRCASDLFSVRCGSHAALRESAIAHKEIDSIHTAASDLEAAANLTRDERHDLVGASELFKQSGDLFKAHGSSWDKAGQMYVKAAECIGESDVNAGVELMKEACAIFEDEARGMFHDATFKKAECFCVSRGKFGSARSLLARQIRIQQRHMNPFEADLYKNCLSIVVLWMHTGDFPKAAEELQKFEGIERFARSEECLAANELVCAWEDSNQEAWDTCLKKQVSITTPRSTPAAAALGAMGGVELTRL